MFESISVLIIASIFAFLYIKQEEKNSIGYVLKDLWFILCLIFILASLLIGNNDLISTTATYGYSATVLTTITTTYTYASNNNLNGLGLGFGASILAFLLLYIYKLFSDVYDTVFKK